jgi:hypothetical protein
MATLISPSGTITENTPTYTWNAVENATDYNLRVNDRTGSKVDQWYSADQVNCGDGTGECSVTPATVLADGSSMWWIQTWNNFGFGPWSATMSFTVDTGTGPNVILDNDGNVVRIENLPVIDENTEEPTIYNVEFVYDTAFNVYGSSLDFDFRDDETIFLALNAVMDALNFNDPDPTPPGAGPQGSDDFFIGNKEEDGLVVAVGGENFAGVWDACVTQCINVGELQTGVTVLAPNELHTYADFTVAQ